ncbi:MAG: hypothetical protein H8E43_01265 [Planctomycetia bacterium]|nr:hypothetical protein [Planctomycetia bacterium]MBL6915082.1 hypothetical protein [Planctomycetota bacterium]
MTLTHISLGIEVCASWNPRQNSLQARPLLQVGSGVRVLGNRFGRAEFGP